MLASKLQELTGDDGSMEDVMLKTWRRFDDEYNGSSDSSPETPKQVMDINESLAAEVDSQPSTPIGCFEDFRLILQGQTESAYYSPTFQATPKTVFITYGNDVTSNDAVEIVEHVATPKDARTADEDATPKNAFRTDVLDVTSKDASKVDEHFATPKHMCEVDQNATLDDAVVVSEGAVFAFDSVVNKPDSLDTCDSKEKSKAKPSGVVAFFQQWARWLCEAQ